VIESGEMFIAWLRDYGIVWFEVTGADLDAMEVTMLRAQWWSTPDADATRRVFENERALARSVFTDMSWTAHIEGFVPSTAPPVVVRFDQLGWWSKHAWMKEKRL
jgi:hypothetical protein